MYSEIFYDDKEIGGTCLANPRKQSSIYWKTPRRFRDAPRGTHSTCTRRGSVAAMTALTDFWLKPLKPPRRWRFSK